MFGALMIAVAVSLFLVGATGAGARVPSFVLGTVAGAIGVVLVQVSRGFTRSFAQMAEQARDLATRGVRHVGVVRDALPYSSPAGGAVFQTGGAQMVLQIELPRDGGGTRTVTCHLVENSEAARGRIGQQIVVLEHPDDPAMRAIEGYLPNGRPRT